MRKVILISAVLAVILLAFVVPGAAAGNWADKANTAWYSDSAKTYDIGSAEELAGFAALVNKGNSFEGKTVRITKDIDLSGLSWTPIGNDLSTPFKGTFDGRNLVISGVTSDVNGLFACIETATIKNVVLKNVTVLTGSATVGGLVGYAAHYCTIENCSVENCEIQTTGEIGDVAAVVGYAKYLTMKNCAASNCVIYVKFSDYAGAFVGYTDSESTISGCKATKCIIAAKAGGVGGIAGRAFDKITITDCDVVSCALSGTMNNNVGGIIGFGGGEVYISNCHVTDTSVIASKHSVGGISGYTYYVEIDSCSVSNCLIESGVEEYVGGFVGSCVAPVKLAGDSTLSSSAVRATFNAATNNVGVVIGRGKTTADSVGVKVSKVLLSNKAGVSLLDSAGFNHAGIAEGSDWKLSTSNIEKIGNTEYGTTVVKAEIQMSDYQSPAQTTAQTSTAAQPTQTKAAASPFALAGLLAGLGAAGLFFVRRG